MKEDKRCCHYDVCRYVHAAHQYGEQCSCESCIHNAHSYVSDDLIEAVKTKRMSYAAASEKKYYHEGDLEFKYPYEREGGYYSAGQSQVIDF